MELSNRLLAVASLVTKGNVVCDVGCDHGYVPIYLIKEKISPRVIAMDVKMGPLEGAMTHIREHGMTDYIETRLSDGVAALQKNEAQTVICAGMGGRLMADIIMAGREVLSTVNELVLQPQSEIPYFRDFLKKEGYMIVAEDIILEDGKYYPMMKAVREELLEGCLSDSEVISEELANQFGGLLLAGKHPVLKKYLLFQKEKYELILQKLQKEAGEDKKVSRTEEIKKEQQLLEKALAFYKE